MNCRIFIEEFEIDNGSSTISLSGEKARYITKVLRLSEGNSITVFNGKGLEYICTISGLKGRNLLLSVMEKIEITRESNLKINLCQALPKGKKMELIIQKGTELGVSLFTPFVSSRTISRPGKKECDSKVKRWQTLALEATRQCGRNHIPVVGSINSLEGILKVREGSKNSLVKIILWEGEEERSFRDMGSTVESSWNVSGEPGFFPEEIVILIGPEGGFSKKEVEAAKKEGFLTVSLGKRLLRTETAGLAAVSILQFLWGDMG